MTSEAEQDAGFEQLLEHIRETRGFDYTGYKRPSLSRRFGKRMQLVGVSSYDEYRAYLEQDEDEFAALFDTILINVTSFFRDEQAWDFVAHEVVPKVLERKAKAGVRVWSTGCATGEEAYSLAMIFAEAVGEEGLRERVKIYATDLDEDALRTGRHGRYTEKQMQPVPEELRRKYFERANGDYVFRGDLRRAVIFGRHDLVRDPPISRIDLLVSRNTLMYFTTDLQKRIIANFHFALTDDGFLFLGKSEVLVARSQLFLPVDLKRRVFAKVPQPRADAGRPPAELEERDRLAEVAAATLMRDAGFESAPVAQIVVDRGGGLVLANMQARILFGLSLRDVGRPLKDLELSYRPVELRSKIEEAYAGGHVIAVREVEWAAGADRRWFDLQIAPLVAGRGDTIGVGITFADVTRHKELQDALENSKRDTESAYEELQSTVEELETTNEELQSTNEELETTNEELQSTNEELETMNEELQSTNEELETINDELQIRTDELNGVNAFLESVLGSLSAGVVVVDGDFAVEAWNAGSQELWGLREEEVLGKNLFGLDIGLPVHELREGVRACIEGEPVDAVILAATNRRGQPITCRVSMSRLNGGDGAIRGAILFMQEGGEWSKAHG